MKSPLINVRQLRYFAKVVETGSITRAAEQLYIAQPALSSSIRQLEDSFGVPLLHRHSRGVEPTPAGELLYSRSCSLFKVLEQIHTDISRFSQTTTRYFSLGLPPSLVMLIGTEAIVAAHEQLPDVVLSLREDPSFALVDAVENKEIDIAFAYSVAERPGIHLTPMAYEQLLLVAHPDQIPPQEVVTLEQTLALPMAQGGKRDAGRCTLEFAAGEQGLSCEVMYEMQSIAGIREIVKRGIAATTLPYGSVAQEVASKELAIRRIDDPHMQQIMYIVRPAHGADPAPLDDDIMSYLLGLVDLIVERQGSLAQKIGLGKMGLPGLACAGRPLSH